MIKSGNRSSLIVESVSNIAGIKIFTLLLTDRAVKKDCTLNIGF